MTTVSATHAVNQISPATERVYHQSNLLGDWKGTWSKTNQPVELKVLSIQGGSAQVEYTHNGHTERGTGTVSGSTVTYGNVTLGTRDGKKAALEFSYGTAKMDAILDKAEDTTAQNKLTGTWIGSANGNSATFKVLAITGRDAQVQVTVNGHTVQGVGDVFRNTVTLGKVQVSSDDGVNGKVVFASGHSTIALAVTKYTPNSTSTVNKLA